jgi:osmotically-inducible protein OsmY
MLLTLSFLGAVGCSSIGNQTAATNLTNADLQRMVQSRLATDAQLNRIDVTADANLNWVSLSGPVPTNDARVSAVDLAKSAQPGLIVVDNMQVKPREAARNISTEDLVREAREAREKARALGEEIGHSVNDAVTYTRIKARLATDPNTSALSIRVDVDGNVVTLRGHVGSAAAKQEAEQIARTTEGVRSVRDLLRVEV